MAEKKLSELSQEELVKIASEQQSIIGQKDKELSDVKAELVAKDKELVSVKADRDAKQSELDGANLVNAQYLEQLSKVPAAAPAEAKKDRISSETFKVGEITYGFKRKAVQEGDQLITAVEVLASQELQKKLVAKQSGMIYEKASA